MLTYQDDVLLTAITLAGYTWLDADKFRKAMGKKIPAEMKKQQELFTAGCVKNGLSQKRAEEFFELIAPFAGYGFNKAHAACYAIIAFRTAYLKANFPVEFMTALLTAESRGTSGPAKNEKIAQAVLECKRLNVPLLPPDINKSKSDFSVEDNVNIRFGLSAVKNVGGAAIENIKEARNEKPFVSLQDFLLRINLSTVNKKTIESLIKSGAMDAFGNRASLLVAYPEIVNKINIIKKQNAEGQKSFFDLDTDSTAEIQIEYTLTEIDDFGEKEKLDFEKEFLGIYLTSHPHLDTLRHLKTMNTMDFEELEEKLQGDIVKVGGIIDSVKKILTKKTQSEMAFLGLTDEKGTALECVIFPKVYDLHKKLLEKDKVVLLSGKIDTKNDKPTILVDSITSMETLLLDLKTKSN